MSAEARPRARDFDLEERVAEMQRVLEEALAVLETIDRDRMLTAPAGEEAARKHRAALLLLHMTRLRLEHTIQTCQ